MNARKYAMQPKKGPALTGGDDRPETPCRKDWEDRRERAARNGTRTEPTPYDLLHDHETGPVFEAARKAAKALCDQCPLKAKCHEDNADEIWVGPIRDAPGRPGRYVTTPCGTVTAYHRHRNKHETPCQPCKSAWAAYQFEKRKGTDAVA